MRQFYCPFQGESSVEYSSTTLINSLGQVITTANHDVSMMFRDWPMQTRLRGYATISDCGTVEFVPYSCRRLPRYTTLFECPNAHIRETREFIICTIRLPKAWGFRKMLTQHYRASLFLHSILKNMLK